MYKIKKSVDLKELEKFGFEEIGQWYIREYQVEDSYYKRNYIRIRNLEDYLYYKEIQDCGEDDLGCVHTNYTNNNIEYLIQDLIKADLVEKVEE